MRLRLLLTGCLSLLVACSTTVSPVSYYVLGLPVKPPPPAEQAAFPYSVAISRFETRPLLLRAGIVWRSGDAVGYYTNDKWAETPVTMFTYRLYRRTSESGLFNHVVPGMPSAGTDLVLEGTLTAFEEVDTPQGAFGRVGIDARLSTSDGKLVWSGTVEKEEPVKGEGAKAVVQAISKATEETITSLLSSIAEALRHSELAPAK